MTARLLRFALLSCLILMLLAAGCGDDGGEDGGDTETTEQTTTTEGTAECREVEKPPAKRASHEAPPQAVKQGDKLTAVISTSCGSFEIALDTQRAPKTTNSFAFLAGEGFFDDTIFHRISPGFVIQGGDPLGTGFGGPGYFVDEPPPPNLAYNRGVVAMAKSSAEPPGRSGSQFFVVTAPATPLPPQYALLGRVSSGMETVDRIAALADPSSPTESPLQTVVLESVTIEEG